MSALIWLLRGILFVILLGLAIKNSGDVELRFFFDASWQTPLSLALLGALTIGVVLGLLALLPQLIRQRRNISTLKRQLAEREKSPAPDTPTHNIDQPSQSTIGI
ncbi:MAG: LapA family protein [Gammaproteobacteria bacterium]|nr:LapA family protein [Rhodocyclaceae bacterium]MBU3908519.1 LapA family protein [Gammaproteobacteria bacterium]MBU3990500.1 LapA family protein [Gammaproteobacteria bacterium]MBU4004547.1 LapA family protein [Gammaproteobacteria bacterium]MBU4021150.1 LapA family protein [Gammaproteobacteria bacterium]